MKDSIKRVQSKLACFAERENFRLKGKKFFYLMAMAIAAVAFTACSDDKTEEVSLIVNNNESEVSIDRIGGEIEVPIVSTGKWTATLDDNSRKWAQVWTGEGDGSGKAVIYVDYLDPRKQLHERKTTLTITAGNKTQTINVRQFIGLRDGETAENEGEIYADLWNGKGIGQGMNPLTGNLTNNCVVNLYGLNKLIKEHPEKYASFFTQSPGPGVNGTVSLVDTLEDNVKTIHAKVGLDIKYATIKFHLDVDFDNKGRQYEKADRYIGSYRTTFLTGKVGLGNIRSAISRDPNLQSDEVQMLLTPIAQDYYLALKEADESKDDETFRETVEAMCSDIGPLIVTKSELGGDCIIQLVFNETAQTDSFKVKGNFTGGITSGVFSLEATANLEYSKFGTDIWKNSTRTVVAHGGSNEALSKMLAALEAGTDDMDVVRKNIKDATVEWVKSINSYDDPDIAKQAKINGKGDNTALVHVEYSPIWQLFPIKYQKKIKNIIVDLYKGKTLVTVDPKMLGIVDDNGNVSE